MSDTLSQRTKIINDFLSKMAKANENEIEKLIIYAYSEGKMSLTEIAHAIGCSRQALYSKYPELSKLKKEKTHES